jgi:hypothetical protein
MNATDSPRSGKEGLDVDLHTPPSVRQGRLAVPAPRQPLARGIAQQDDVRAGVPAAQLGRPVRVVGEQEVLDRMLLPASRAGPVTGGQLVDARRVLGLERTPLRLLQNPGHRSRVGAPRRGERPAVASARAHREVHHR